MDIEAQLARRIADLRARHGWTLAEFAERSGVSKSMLSKVERQEASPTATILLRVAAALGLTLAELMSEQVASARFLQRGDQPSWTDPATGYERRQVYLSPAMPLELVEVHMPPGKQVAAAASSYALIRQVVWVLEGCLVIQEGPQSTALTAGDRLEFGPPSNVVFRNDSAEVTRYLVAVLRG
ncbi:helix-turn-helix domain-containing protein [Phenylobacterium sp.]|uniref:helix-turn-helix domain-containing protein n=1 Tax=Phenylobacterium sp. TaxID=1871053 RepID=UPI0030F48E6D